MDAPPTDLEVEPGGRLYALHTPHEQTLTFIPSASVWEAVKVWREVNRLVASAGVEKLAGRFVFDFKAIFSAQPALRNTLRSCRSSRAINHRLCISTAQATCVF
ncbi:MAG: hypothetical protein AAB225_30585 [Acidobacteriota bacterium]